LQSAPDVPDAPTGAAPAAKVAAGAAALAAAKELADEDPVTDDDMPQKFDYDRPIGALAEKYESENPETIDLDDEDLADKPKKAAASGAAAKSKNKISVPNFDRFRVLMGVGGAALIGLIIFMIFAIFVLPKAAITLTTASEPVTANFTLKTSDKNTLDPATGSLPAKLETTDQTGTQQVTATGQQNNGQKASGSVTMTTQRCAPNLGSTPDDVSSGTGVNSSGANFITQQKAHFTFSGFSSGSCANYSANSVTIAANAQGSKYNVSSATFTVAGRSDVAASGSTSGGTDEIVTILSQSDVDNAKTKLTSGTTGDQFTKDFQKKLSDQGEYVLATTLKAGDAQVNAVPAVGQPASTANVSIKINYTVLTVKKDELKQVIQAKLADQVNKSKQKLNDNFMDDSNISVQSQSSPSSAVLLVNVNTTAVPIIDTATVKAVAKGKKAGDIKAAINNWPGVKNVDIKLSPFWVSKAPGNDSKIKVILIEDKSQDNSKSAP
jgi:hypothetical protein